MALYPASGGPARPGEATRHIQDAWQGFQAPVQRALYSLHPSTPKHWNMHLKTQTLTIVPKYEDDEYSIITMTMMVMTYLS
jgi:hypothetical protein